MCLCVVVGQRKFPLQSLEGPGLLMSLHGSWRNENSLLVQPCDGMEVKTRAKASPEVLRVCPPPHERYRCGSVLRSHVHAGSHPAPPMAMPLLLVSSEPLS